MVPGIGRWQPWGWAPACWLGAALLAAGAAVIGPGAAEQGPQTEGRLEAGRRVYEANCAFCHGPRGDGQGMMGHMFRIKPRDLDGTPMPSYREALTPDELWALVYYLESLVTRVFPPDVVVGEERMGRMVLRMHRGGGGMGGQGAPR